MPGDGRAERGRLESPGFGEESAGHIPGRWPPMGAARFAGRRLGDGDSRLGARGKSAPRLEKEKPQRAQRDTKFTKNPDAQSAPNSSSFVTFVPLGVLCGFSSFSPLLSPGAVTALKAPSAPNRPLARPKRLQSLRSCTYAAHRSAPSDRR